MDKQKLSKAPLVEVIFELRWMIIDSKSDLVVDPHYKIFLYKLIAALEKDYPFPEPLPTAEIPEQIAGYVVQHRFRKKKDRWPLIQVGPGIITLNDTEEYLWNDFAKRISDMINLVFDIHPASDKLELSGILLRYIDSCDFDYEQSNILDFLSSKLKINVIIAGELFNSAPEQKIPLGVDLKFTYPSDQPRGVMHLRCARGMKKEKTAFVWETVVQSLGHDVPKNKEGIVKWAEDAHTLTHKWFFKMIEGDLLEEFR